MKNAKIDIEYVSLSGRDKSYVDLVFHEYLVAKNGSKMFKMVDTEGNYKSFIIDNIKSMKLKMEDGTVIDLDGKTGDISRLAS